MNINQQWIRWATDILKGMGLQPTQNRIEFLYAWMSGENTKAANNPLATTWDMKRVDPGQTNFNWNGGFPVKNYSNWDRIGLRATLNTLLAPGIYPEILRFLRNDISIGQATPLLIRNLQTWGTGQLPVNVWKSWSAGFKKKIGESYSQPARCECCGRACDCLPVQKENS